MGGYLSTMKSVRAKEILALRQQGMPYGVSRIRAICLTYRYSALNEPPLLEGMSTITARDVYHSIGLWPNERNAPQIAQRLAKVLAATTRRKTIKELGAWLQSLKLLP